MVDVERLSALLDLLKEETTHLRRLAQLSQEEVLADTDIMASIKYRFVVAIEICNDVAHHIISSEGLRAPTDFADAFGVLGDADFLPKELVPMLKEMAKFRNLLVHLYSKVNDAKVLEILHTRPGDFDAFRAAVAQRALNQSSAG